MVRACPLFVSEYCVSLFMPQYASVCRDMLVSRCEVLAGHSSDAIQNLMCVCVHVCVCDPD